MNKQSKLGLASIILAAVGLLGVALNFNHLIFYAQFESAPRVYYWLPPMELMALFIGLASLFVKSRRKQCGKLGIALSVGLLLCLTSFYFLSYIVIGQPLPVHH